MYIIQVKQNPNLENYVDMAEEEKPAAAKQRMKQLVGKYQSQGRIVEVKAEAKMQYEDYFEDEDPVEIDIPEELVENQREMEREIQKKVYKAVDVSGKESPCKGEICAHYDNGECESFDDINDPIVNSESECQGFMPGGKSYILDEIKRVAAELEKTPSMSDMDDHTDIDRNEYYRKFDGYKDACKQAGLKPNKAGGGKQ